MGPKRDHDALTYSDNEELAPQPVAKRRKEHSSAKSKTTEPKTDSTYGQRAAFPGLDEPAALSDEDLEFEDQGDALAYLRSVRQEANGIPHLLVAPKAGPQLPPYLSNSDSNNNVDRSIYHDGLGDSRGYYQGGAYTAAPDNLLQSVPEDDDNADDYYGHGHGYGGANYDDDSDSDWSTSTSRAHALLTTNRHLAREAYFASLMTQFSALRTMLHQTPPPSLLSSLDKDHGYQVGSFGPKSWTFRVWMNRIRYTDPIPAQVAAMDRFGALKLLRVILGGKFIRRGCELRERTSRWIWALLARLPDRGEMDHTDIGWVRELGKRAVLMMVSIAQMAALKEEVEGDLEGQDLLVGDDDREEEEEEEVLVELEPDTSNEGVGRAEEEEEEEVSNETEDQAAEKDGVEAATAEDSSTAANLITEDQGNSSTVEQQRQEQEETGEGEIDMDIDDGEVLDEEGGPDPPASSSKDDAKADIAAAKARLLAQLDEDTAAADAEAQQREDELTRQRLNMRATLNMILTIAGEFYGQRDLLEFRDPFPAL
ncbi:hypothetical protein N0V85_005521 [Neurospora sp. IMI 360204]|nr:hypothetical protein N0V85_005521 [Neurospora sp. IMI 360204]